MTADRQNMPPFHLAIRVGDLGRARGFYGGVLGCSEGRSTGEWVDFEFFGHQLVCHAGGDRQEAVARHNVVDGDAVPVPHFGVVLPVESWESLVLRLGEAGIEPLLGPRTRFAGQPGEQRTLFVADPDGNVLEFKAMRDPGELFRGGAPA